MDTLPNGEYLITHSAVQGLCLDNPEAGSRAQYLISGALV